MTQIKLPAELWNDIFKYLDRRDVNVCSTTCKLWKTIIECYYQDKVNISVDDSKFKRLLDDLIAFPGFAAKIQKLTVTSDDEQDNTEHPITLRSIINHCPNLHILKFTETNVYSYLKALNCKDTIMPNIQKIKVSQLLHCSPAVRRFHIWVNYRFKSTIKSLTIMDLNDNGALNNYNGLINFTASFPNLTRLKARANVLVDREVRLNLHELLVANSNLQVLELSGIGRMESSPNDIPAEINIPSLKRLHIDALHVKIQTLAYIVAKCKSLEELCLSTTDVMPNESLSAEEEENILEDFTSMSVDSLNVSYHYKNKHYHNSNRKTCTGLFAGIVIIEHLRGLNFYDDYDEDYDDQEFFEDDYDDDDDDDYDHDDFGLLYNHGGFIDSHSLEEYYQEHYDINYDDYNDYDDDYI